MVRWCNSTPNHILMWDAATSANTANTTSNHVDLQEQNRVWPRRKCAILTPQWCNPQHLRLMSQSVVPVFAENSWLYK